MQTPGTKEHGPQFAELHAHLNIFLAKMTYAEWEWDTILTLELICEGQEDSLSF